MKIETDEWTTASEASRILHCSHQRIMAMADDDGSLDAIRPWPHTLLIGRRSLAEWVAGARPQRIQPAQARAWVLERTGAGKIQELDIDVVRDLLREFIAEARPRWEAQRSDLWALTMAGRLWGSGAAVRAHA